VGYISPDGTQSESNWCVLTNSSVPFELPVRGGLYVDQTGVFGNKLIVVTSSSGSGSIGTKGVWEISSTNGNPTPMLLASIDTPHLEGVITLPNDTNLYGPWAGKIVTGDEQRLVQRIYTITANGVVTGYNTTNYTGKGISPEDFDIIPSGQDLYVCGNSYNNNSGVILKLDRRYFTDNIGDLLITDSGEFSPPNCGTLYIAHWNQTRNSFDIKHVYYHGYSSTTRIEHVTFAPLQFPIIR
jgi:hypothetical protein